MTTTSRTLVTILILLGIPVAHLLWAADEAYEELYIFDLILGIIENPDPIPQVHWMRLTADPNQADSRTPDQRADGRPVFEFNRATAEPYLAWAYDVGNHRDIAFNAWHGNGWDPQIEFATTSAADEVDPRMYVDHFNNLYLTWWEDHASGFMRYTRREARGWGATIDIGPGRRPSIAVWDGDVVVAYERNHPMGQEIVFAVSKNGGSFVEETVAVTTRTKRLDPIVRVRDDRLWIDWKDSDNVIGFSQNDQGKWQMPRTMPWDDPSWLGELTARHAIELELTP